MLIAGEKDSRLQKCISDIMRSPRHIVKRALKDSVRYIDNDTYYGNIDKLIRESIHKLSEYAVLRIIRAFPDSKGRNRLILRFQDYCVRNYREQMFRFSLRRMMISLLRSRFVEPWQIMKAIDYYPNLAGEAMEHAIQLAAVNRVGISKLLLKLAGMYNLKTKDRIKMAEAILGLDEADKSILICLISLYPFCRYRAASVVLDRFPNEISPDDIKSLCIHKDIKELVKIMLPDRMSEK